MTKLIGASGCIVMSMYGRSAPALDHNASSAARDKNFDAAVLLTVDSAHIELVCVEVYPKHVSMTGTLFHEAFDAAHPASKAERGDVASTNSVARTPQSRFDESINALRWGAFVREKKGYFTFSKAILF